MSRRRDLAVIALVLVLVTGPAVAQVADPSHLASSGVTYQTNSGLQVTLTDERDVEAVPFADNRTFASQGVEVEAGGTASVSVSDQSFSGESMAVREIDASQNAIILRRDDLNNDVTVSGGATDIIINNMTLDDGETDFDLVTNSEANVSVTGLPDAGNIQAVNSTGDVVASADTATGTLTFDAGSYQVRLQEAPDELAIRELQSQELITEDANGSSINVELTFFGGDGAVATRNTTDGRIDMSGLPVDERFSVSVDAGDQYVDRQILIPSLLEQKNAYLLNQTADVETVNPRIRLEDPSNQFSSEQSEVVFKRPIERDDGTTEFVAVAGDRVGLNGFDTTLEQDQRYRVTVTDPQTDASRQLGEFTASRSEVITFTVEDVEFDSVADADGIDWTAEYLANEDSSDQIRFIFRDSQPTATLSYHIYERGNENNTLVNTTTNGNTTVTEPVPPDSGTTVWRVEWTATRDDGETLTGARLVSTDQLPIGTGLGERWQTIISIIGLFAVAGLFGSVNPGVGGIAVASTGGMLFLIGWLPDSTGGLMVLLALFISVLAYVGRRARGATA